MPAAAVVVAVAVEVVKGRGKAAVEMVDRIAATIEVVDTSSSIISTVVAVMRARVLITVLGRMATRMKNFMSSSIIIENINLNINITTSNSISISNSNNNDMRIMLFLRYIMDMAVC